MPSEDLHQRTGRGGLGGAAAWPLVSRAQVFPSRGQYDTAVYRDQLLEVERDVARGVLTPEEAGAARLEIQRRLLAADASAAVVGGSGPGPARR